jgi:hypothetical protein
MFQVFRRHQKLLLTSIAVIAIGSMAFSAIAPLFLDEQKSSNLKMDLIKDPHVAMMRLFNHSFDASNRDIIFPDALFTQMIVKTQIMQHVYTQYAPMIDEELAHVFESIEQGQSPEVIPGATLEQVMAQLSPKLQETAQKLKASKSLSGQEKILALCQFFEEKSKFPMPLMYQYLQAISKNNVLVTPDELNFFGLKNPEDFFGKTLVEQGIKGIMTALKEEVKTQNTQYLIQSFAQKLKSFYGVDVHPNQFFIACGMTPEAGVEVLKHVQALKVLKDTLSQKLLLDPITYKAVSDYANLTVPVEIFSFDSALDPKNLEEALCLDLYAEKDKALKFDEYEIKIRTLDKNKALQTVPKKQQYAEALKGYDELSALMPYALSKNLVSEKERLEAIKNLSGSSKQILDDHFKKICLKNDPQFFHKMLQEISSQSQVLKLAKGAKKSPILGFSSVDALKNELEMLPLNTPCVFEISDSYLHEIEVVSKNLNKGKLSYQDAMASGYLKEALRLEVENVYKDAVKKSPIKFLNADKKTKSLDECYQDILEIHAKDLKARLANLIGVSSDVSSAFLLKGYAKMALKQALEKGLTQEDFRIIKHVGILSLKEQSEPSVKALFNKNSKGRSDIVMDSDGRYSLYVKTGPVEQGEPLLNKSAIEILAQELVIETIRQRNLL